MGEFRKAIDNEIAKIEAEQKEQQEREAAAKSQLQKAREKAVIVRDKIIIPLLNGLRDDFAAETKKVLPNWQVQSDGNIDESLELPQHRRFPLVCHCHPSRSGLEHL